ncbi:MAG: FtsW/RodA/SpoVE family cell cycle protein [Kiritimatiellae bacterium]|nr:FtsW/RodA/SpoVE family cell cycle protein [Kiritimatiellia bacterium]
MRRDWWMCAAVLALAVFGVLLQVRLAESVPALQGLSPLLAGLVVGVGASVACGGGRAGRFLAGKGKWIAFGVASMLLLALLAFGRRYRGGLYLPGRINPSELVKLCLVAFLAGWMGTPGRSVKGLSPRAMSPRAMPRIVRGLSLCGVLFLLVAATGDFGLLAQLAITVAAVLWAASWLWGGFAFVALAGGMVLVASHPSGHLATRFAVWRDPFGDVTGTGWQTLQGLTAILSGGMTGAGFGMGDVQAVPIVASDFVYAALAEDLGLAGCLVVLALWALVLARGIMAAARRAEVVPTEALLATGIVASLAVQLVLNVAGVLNALPMTGITLPLISLGGSSQATVLAMCGVLAGVSGTIALERT